MLSSVLLAATSFLPVQDQAVNLGRVNKVGEKLTYQVKSHLFIESREIGLQTFLPETLDNDYTFTTEVQQAKADGVVVMHYLRPQIKSTTGETADAGPKTTIVKTNDNLQFDITPINEIIGLKDLSKKDDKKKGGGSLNFLQPVKQQDPFMAAMAPFTGEVYRLAMFLGGLDSSIDFFPKLPFDSVKPGDTWKKTVGYSPQKLQGKNKSAMQRMDYTFTYVGLVDSEGKKVRRVTADLNLDSNLLEFFLNQVDADASNSPFKEIHLTLKAKIDFDLDPTTNRTLLAVGTSEGGFKAVVTRYPEDPVVEQKLKGRTVMRLTGQK